MKRRIFFVLLLVLMLAGCTHDAGKPKTAEEFKTSAEELRLEVTDQTDSVNGDKMYQTVYAATDGDKYSFEYYFMTGIDPAKKIYTYISGNLDAIYKDDGSAAVTSVSDETKGRFTVSASDHYCEVIHDKNTVLYLNSDAKYKDEAKKLLNELQ